MTICTIAVFLPLAAGAAFAQSADTPADNPDEAVSRGSIPADLLRPRRDESLRYPVDMVIGPLGRGDAPQDAYEFAGRAASDLLAANADAASLAAMNSVSLEGILSSLEQIDPRNFRMGSGRQEDDGAVSFLVRFIGREQSITGELFVRMKEAAPDEETPAPPEWLFEDLILDNARTREEEIEQGEPRFDFSPYERFF